MQGNAPAFYRSLDPVSNLVIRCSLRQVRGPAISESAATGQQSAALPPGAPSTAVGAPSIDSEGKHHDDSGSAAGSATSGQLSQALSQANRFSEGDVIQVVDIPWQGKLFGPQ